MQDYGLVSIITPTWACSSFISETIRSVMAQTYQNWELFIFFKNKNKSFAKAAWAFCSYLYWSQVNH